MTWPRIETRSHWRTLPTRPMSRTRRVSGDFDILLSSAVRHLNDPSKNIRSFRIVAHVSKLLQNFGFSLLSLLNFRLSSYLFNAYNNNNNTTTTSTTTTTNNKVDVRLCSTTKKTVHSIPSSFPARFSEADMLVWSIVVWRIRTPVTL